MKNIIKPHSWKFFKSTHHVRRKITKPPTMHTENSHQPPTMRSRVACTVWEIAKAPYLHVRTVFDNRFHTSTYPPLLPCTRMISLNHDNTLGLTLLMTWSMALCLQMENKMKILDCLIILTTLMASRSSQWDSMLRLPLCLKKNLRLCYKILPWYPGVQVDVIASARGQQTYKMNKNVRWADIFYLDDDCIIA